MAKATVRKGGLRRYASRANLLTSLVLIFPLFLLYQLAVLCLPDVGNGADLITGRLMGLLGTRVHFLLFDLLLLAGFLVGVSVLRRRHTFDPRLFIPVIIESGVYALTMGALISYVMSLIGISPKLSLIEPALHAAATANATIDKAGPLARVALSLGAGVNEELVFRLLMIPALVFFFEKVLGLRVFTSVLLAFIFSSLLFSAAHHVIGGEPWRLGPFVYRFFCGLIFATLFRFRGFAVAVYTHALYDIYVMLFVS